MTKINKDYNPKIIALLIVVMFLLNNTVYGIELFNKANLRVPIGMLDTNKRIQEALYDSLESKSSFSYEANSKKIIYIGAIRYEFSMDKKLIACYSIEDINRDWRNELLELNIELNSLVGTMHPLSKEPTQYLKGSNLLDLLVARRNRSPGLIRAVADKRSVLVQEALVELKNINENTVNIYVSYQFAAGVLGTARLIADGLIAASPNIKVNIVVLDDRLSPDNVDFAPLEGSSINLMEGMEVDLIEMAKLARVHIDVSRYLDFDYDTNDVRFDVDPLPTCQGRARVADVRYYRGKGNSDLQDPFGTLYLDKDLLKKREEKDSKSFETILAERKSWLQTTLGQEQLIALNSIAGTGWDPLKAIWTWGYFQDTVEFLKEINILRQIFLSPESHNIPFVKNGEQLIIHLVRGKPIKPHLQIIDLSDMGITIIDEYGMIHKPAIDKKVPITVILYDAIEHNKLKTLQSELSGTMTRDKKDKFWIDFPVFVTGTASWLEAVSSGSICLHDGYDAGDNKKGPILLSTLIRMLALRDRNKEYPYEKLEKEAKKLVDGYLMGEKNNLSKYSDLEAWTKQAREYTDAMFKFNMIDDMIIALRDENAKSSQELLNVIGEQLKNSKKILTNF